MLKRIILVFSLSLGFIHCALAGVSSSDESNLKQRKASIALVNNMAGLVRKVGRIRAVCEINKYNRGTKKDEPYVFAFVCNDGKNDSFVLANKNIGIVFTSLYQHPNHILFRRMLKKRPNGIWVSYRVNNPDTGKVGAKHSYVVMLRKYKICIGSGYYTSLD